MADTFNTRHKQTGILQRLTADQISVFPDQLEIVADDAKPFEPGEFVPGAENPEPLTDAQIQAQADLDAALEAGSPNTKAAKEARAAKKAADEQAEKDAAAAEAEAERLRKLAAEGAESSTAAEGYIAPGAPFPETEGQ